MVDNLFAEAARRREIVEKVSAGDPNRLAQRDMGRIVKFLRRTLP